MHTLVYEWLVWDHHGAWVLLARTIALRWIYEIIFGFVIFSIHLTKQKKQLVVNQNLAQKFIFIKSKEKKQQV